MLARARTPPITIRVADSLRRCPTFQVGVEGVDQLRRVRAVSIGTIGEAVEVLVHTAGADLLRRLHRGREGTGRRVSAGVERDPFDA